MSNWIESEENKKRIAEAEKRIAEAENFNKSQNISVKKELLLNNLVSFIELCKRIGLINNAFCIINKDLDFVGKNNINSSSRHQDAGNPYDGPPAHWIDISYIRGIKFTVTHDSDLIGMIIYQTRHEKVSYIDRRQENKEIILNKVCSNHDIINWTEESMTNTIRWIVGDLDYIEESLPGDYEGLIKKRLQEYQINMLAEKAEKAKREEEKRKADRRKNIGCFIATACYGNYDAPEVLILRQFRDENLLKSFLGRVLVKFYYSVSPFCATLISKSDLLKKMVRQNLLEPIISKIKRQNWSH